MKKALLGLILAISLGANSFAVDCKDPKLFMEGLTGDVLKVLDNPANNAVKKETELTKMFNTYIDADWMGRFVLGRHWRSLQKPQQDKYLSVYKTFLIKTYVGKFNKYTGKETVTVNSSKPLSTPGEFYVTSTIKAPNQQDLEVGFRIKKVGACYKLNDLVGEGVSLINTQRQDFNSVMTRKGYNDLIQLLEEKIKNGGQDVTQAAAR